MATKTQPTSADRSALLNHATYPLGLRMLAHLGRADFDGTDESLVWMVRAKNLAENRPKDSLRFDWNLKPFFQGVVK